MILDVKNILFDLGGVILDIDYNRPVEAFKKLGAADFEEVFSQQNQAKFLDQFERGEITPAQFRKHLRPYLPEKVTDAQIDAAWCTILGELPSQRIVQLKQLRKLGYRLFLLSNTNSIHIRAFTHYLDETYGKNLFKDLFEKVYYSSQIGLRKPTRKVFDFVMKENGIKASETLFIDDSLQHIEGAQKAGLHTHWLQEPQTINDYFKDVQPASPGKVQ
jgi:HAD superfamily hydrolase (TIGR01549 family)